ncbi:MAG: hypothetical protein HC822_01965 [Oscillochloris sp.]|nr:hypothetical protein [Oscillochloris sp.]
MSRPAQDEVRTLLLQLADQGGPRPPSSPAEATIAAYLNARLRRSGMRVDTREVHVTPYRSGAHILPTLLAILAAVTLIWLPLPALLLAIWAVLAALANSLFAPLSDLLPRRPSQTIIANRAVEPHDTDRPAAPRRRVLLIAPLDTPPQRHGLATLAGPGRSATLLRLLLLALPGISAALSLWYPAFALSLGVISTLAQVPLLIAARTPPTLSTPFDGGIGALATLIATAQRLTGLQHVELWAIGVGGAYADRAGVELVVRRFPFHPGETLAIVIQHLDQGQLSYATRTGALGNHPMSNQLLQFAAAVDASDSSIDAEPRPYYADDDLTLPFLRRAIPTLCILSLPNGESNSNATPADPALVERAARLIAGIVRRLDAAVAHETSKA